MTAPAPAKYTGSGRLRFRNPVRKIENFTKPFCPSDNGAKVKIFEQLKRYLNPLKYIKKVITRQRAAIITVPDVAFNWMDGCLYCTTS